MIIYEVLDIKQLLDRVVIFRSNASGDGVPRTRGSSCITHATGPQHRFSKLCVCSLLSCGVMLHVFCNEGRGVLFLLLYIPYPF